MISLEYLKSLYNSGYFNVKHIISNGVILPDTYACRDDETWKRCKEHLIESGYLKICYTDLSQEEMKQIHPKDLFDYWSFELTDKGLKYLKDSKK